MHKTPELPELLNLLDERSAAFRAVIRSAPDLGARVPSCPDWTLLDLARHVGGGQRRWAGVVAAGPGADAPAESSTEIGRSAPAERKALLNWLGVSAERLLGALRDVDPDRGCWTWWGDSESPQTVGAVARHQVQEAAVHTYDAQLAAGAPRPLPTVAAVDGVEEFLTTCGTTTKVAWPYEPALVDVHAAEGASWRVTLSDAGARVSVLPSSGSGRGSARDSVYGVDADESTASLRGTASDLVLALYDRVPLDTLELGGDRKVLDLLRAWDLEP